MNTLIIVLILVGGMFADMYLYERLEGSYEPIFKPLVDRILEENQITDEPTSTEETPHEEDQSKEEALSS